MHTKRLQELGLLRKSHTESSSYVYTSQPTDDIDFMRMLDGREDFYRLPVQADVPTKKHIIITDPSVRYELLPEENVINMWSSLLEQGFAISVWTGSEVTRVTTIDELRTALQQVEPVHHQDLLKHLAKSGMASDDCYLAGAGHTRELMREFYHVENTDYLHLDAEEIDELPIEEKEQFLACIPDHPLLGLKIKQYLDQNRYQPIQLSSQLEQYLKRHPRVFFDNVDTAEEYKKILTICPALQEVQFYRSSVGAFAQVQLLPKTVKKVVIDHYSLTWDLLAAYLQNCRVLEELLIQGDTTERVNMLGELSPDIAFQSTLKKLGIHSKDVTWSMIAQLIKNLPSLESLDLTGCRSLGKLPENFTLPASLKELVLDKSSIKSVQLNELLKNNKELKKLSLNECISLDAGKIPDDFHLPTTLIELNLKDADISVERLQKIMDRCQSLEKINIEYQDIPETLIFPETIKEVVLTSTQLSWERLNDLLSNARSLEKLDIRHCTMNGDIPSDFSLPATIKEINLSYAKKEVGNLEWKDIMNLIQRCPAIEKVDISSLNNLGELPKSFSFPNTLKELDVSSSDIALVDLASLLKNNQSLRILDLSSVKDFGGVPENLILPPTLEKILFKYSGINWTQLSQLIVNYKKMEYLDLSYCGSLGSLPEDLSFLSHIRSINLIGTKMPKSEIERLRRACPDLEITTSTGKKLKGATATGQADQQTAGKAVKPAAVHKQPSTHKLDADTGQDEPDLHAQQAFDQDIPVNNYRNQVIEDISITEDEVKIVTKEPVRTPKELEKPTPGAKAYTGIVTLGNDWLCLPSLTAEDKLIGIKTSPAVELVIAYDKETAFYYVKPKKNLESKTVTVSFTIEADLTKNKFKLNQWKLKNIDLIKQLRFTKDGTLKENAAYKKFAALSQTDQIDALVAYFVSFKEKSIAKAKGHELLNTVIEKQAGVCRHRTLACLALAKAFKLPIRSVWNDVHANVEIKQGGAWCRADLGGGAGKLTVSARPEFKEVKEEPKKKTSPIPKKESASATISAENPFRTWDTVLIQAESMPDYVSQLVTQADKLGDGRKNALCLLDRSQIGSFHTALLQQNKGTCLYLPDLNNISDTKTIIDNDSGKPAKKDSDLKQFLQNAKPGDVLLVNWSDYQTEHVGYNSMIDPVRKIKGMAIPPGVIVMSVLDRTQHMGEDFYSRFRLVSDCPTGLAPVSLSLQPKPDESQAMAVKPRVISFYDDLWRSVLLGAIQADSGRYHIAESEFIKAIKANEKTIVLRNAPWHLPEFQLFMTELMAKRQIEVNGEIIKLPDGIKITRDDTPYPITQKNYSIENLAEDAVLTNTFILNSMTMNTLLQRVKFDNNKPITLKGYIGENANKPLKLLVTESLSTTQWYRILNEAEVNKTTLHLILGPGVRLPSEMMKNVSFQESKLPAKITSKQASVVVTNDVDFYDAFAAPDVLEVPITEKTTFAELIGMHKVIDRDDGEKDYYFQAGEVTKALLAGKKVFLKGTLSPALAKQLETMFLVPPYLQVNGERIENLTGELRIYTEVNPGIPFVSSITSSKQTIGEGEYWSVLTDINKDKAILLKKICDDFYAKSHEEHFTYIELRTMLNHLIKHPHNNPLKSLLRVRKNYRTLRPIAEEIWQLRQPPVKQKTVRPVMRERLVKTKRILKHNWYVFIVGSSGVGKTTTIKQAMKAMGYEPVEIIGSLKDKLKELLKVKPGVKKALFIDEANLYEAGAFDILEGLYDKPPRLFIDGVFIPVPTDVRIFFAGNFGHFKGRQELNFIARHGNVITYKEFDRDYVRDSIIQPVCDKFNIEKAKADRIKKVLISIYEHINKKYPEKHPLTARNLHMMIMRYAVNKQNIYMAAYDEISGILKQDDRREVADWINKRYHYDVRKKKKALKQRVVAPDKMKITKKRINPIRVFNDFMALRDAKINDPTLAGQGTSGIILEGLPGIGKSFLALEYLRANGFVDGDAYPLDKALITSKRYYHIQAGNRDEIIAKLIKAYYEGAVVIMDEMNTMNIEMTLNALLSGDGPDASRIAKPGFAVIGTQNPIEFGKREAGSDAFLNRFQKIDLKEFGRDDLVSIARYLLTDKYKKYAGALVDQFLEAQRYARAHNKTPEPTPRDLFEHIKAVNGGLKVVVAPDVQPKSKPETVKTKTSKPKKSDPRLFRSGRSKVKPRDKLAEVSTPTKPIKGAS